MSRTAGIFIALVLAAVPAGAADTPPAAVEKLHAVLLSNMKQGDALDYQGRAARLDPVVRGTFDLETMARVSTGAAWRTMTDAQRRQVVEAFTAWTIANYASQFDAFDGERFVTKDEQDAGRGNVLVNTELHAGDETIALNYRLRPSDGEWRIIDIYMDGAVSQLAMRRGEFAAVLGKGGVDELVGHIDALVAKLAAGG